MRPRTASRLPGPPVPLALLALLASPGCGDGSPSHADLPRGPHDVIVVLVDTLRADRLGVYGYERPTSPVLDAFAEEALVFERCISQSTWTKPSVASLMTGLFPSEHQVHRYRTPLGDEFVTLAELLSERGYQTAGVVANLLVADPAQGYGQGFETFEMPEITNARLPYPTADDVVDACLDRIAAAGPEPLFLYAHLIDPHAPYAPPEPFRSAFDRGVRGERDGFFLTEEEGHTADVATAEDWQHWSDLYDGEIAFSDRELGRLFDGLRDAGRFDEALVVFLSDHGEEFFEHGGWMHNPNMYQEVVHVPLLVKPPASWELEVGTRVADTVMQIDVLPTVADVVGLEARDAWSGTSLLLRALRPAGSLPTIAYSEVQNHGHVRRAIFEGPWKRIRADAPERVDLLFDLDTDPREREDLFDAYGTPLARLEALLAGIERLGDRRVTLGLELSNGTPSRRSAQVWIGSAVQVAGLDPAGNASRGAAEAEDGPLTSTVEDWEGTSLPTVGVTVDLPPGDVDRFYVRFAPGTESAQLQVLVNGEPIAASAVRFGSEGVRAGALPTPLELDAEQLVGEPVLDGAELTIGAWVLPGGAHAPVELDAESMADLRALGYGGGD